MEKCLPDEFLSTVWSSPLSFVGFLESSSLEEFGPVKKFYAVCRGLRPGIYSSWEECRRNVDGFSCSEFRRFGTLGEARGYLLSN